MLFNISRASASTFRQKSFPVARRIQRSSASYIHTTRASEKLANPSWATLDPDSLGTDSKPHHVLNIVGGKWNGDSKTTIEIPNPMDKDAPVLCTVPDTAVDELDPFINSMKGVTKSGVHNPLKNVERYLMYGDISRRVSICQKLDIIEYLFHFSL